MSVLSYSDPATVGHLTRCPGEAARDSDTRNTLGLLFPMHLCLQRVMTVDKLLPTTVKYFPSPLLTCHGPKLYLLQINKHRHVSTWEAAKPHANALGNERNAVPSRPRAEDHIVADDDLQSYFQSSSSQAPKRNGSALTGFVCVSSAQPLRVAVLVAQLWKSLCPQILTCLKPSEE